MIPIDYGGGMIFPDRYDRDQPDEPDPCDNCDGSGEVFDDWAGVSLICPVCNGRGWA